MKSKTPLTLEEEILARDFSNNPAEPPLFPLDRRDFLKLLGGGIVISVAVPSVWAQREGGPGRGQPLPTDFNAFLRIGEDGRVTGYTGKIEMGQGIITSLAQMLAEELDVAYDRVPLVMGDTDLCPWDMGTFGSMTTRFFGPPFLRAAAEAKAVLVELASQKLGVPKEKLKTKDGVVYEASGSKKITYAELARSTACLAGRLQALGLEAGQRVAILLPNSVQWVQVCCAALRAGLVSVPIAYESAVPEITYRLSDAGCRALVATDEMLERRLDDLREPMAEITPVERGVRVGDVAVIDGEVEVDGKVVESETRKSTEAEVREGVLLPELVSALPGTFTGETREVQVDFPADYTNPDLAGKHATIRVTVRSRKSRSWLTISTVCG